MAVSNRSWWALWMTGSTAGGCGWLAISATAGGSSVMSRSPLVSFSANHCGATTSSEPMCWVSEARESGSQLT